MKNIYKKYSEFLKEHALFDSDFERFDIYSDNISNSKLTLKNFNIEINNLIDKLSNISETDIKLSNNKYRDGENFEINFGKEIELLITPIKIFLNDIENENIELYKKIINQYFDGYDPNFSFDIYIEKNRFNKFHFPIELPNIFKNIGLGVKIVLASINKLNYLLFTKNDDSFELKMVVDNISKRNDYYTFIKDSNVMIFKDDFFIIKEILNKWLLDIDIKNDNYALDKDFYNKYTNDIKKDDFLNIVYKKI